MPSSATTHAREAARGRGAHDEAALLDLLAALVRGDRVPSEALAGLDPERLRASAEFHGVLPLVARDLAGRRDGPSALGARLAERVTRQAALDLVREAELTRLIEGLGRARIGALIMKGAQLAYTDYPRPDLRPRLDTDLLISVSARPAAHTRLVELGYESGQHVTGDLVMYQAAYVQRCDGVPVHLVDLHWRVANPQRFGGVLAYDELAAAAVPIASLGRHARGLSAVHALMLACIHPIAHHAHTPRLIWQYDIHLVASRLAAADWDEFVELANARRVSRVCRRSLELSATWFRTNVPASVFDRFSDVTATDAATAAYLSPTRRQIHDAVWDFRTLPTWADRWRLVRQHLFPPARYMRDVYAPASSAPLPVLYARRAFRGARRWLARS